MLKTSEGKQESQLLLLLALLACKKQLNKGGKVYLPVRERASCQRLNAAQVVCQRVRDRD